jgi:hypothetical protein
LPSSRLRPDRLRAAVQAAMACKAGAARIAAAFSTTGPGISADALESLLLTAKHPGRAAA